MLTKSRLAGWSMLAAAPLLLAAELVRSDHSESKYTLQLSDVAASRAPELALASPKLPQATAASSLEQIGNSSAFAIFLPLLLALIVGPVLLTIGLSRAGLARWWIAPIWLVAAVAYASGLETSRLGSLVSFGPMMAALAYLGLQTLRVTPTSAQTRNDRLAPSATVAEMG
jgi:hypothetical protein